MASLYVQIVSPSALFYMYGAALWSIISSMGKPQYTLIAMMIASVIHWGLAYVFAVVLGWKMVGVALASSIQFFIRYFVTHMILLNKEEYKKCIIPFSDPRSWEGLREMHNLGIQNAMLRIMGWWAFEVLTQMAAFLQTTELAGQTILRNIGLYTFMIPVGLSQATNYLVGRQIGRLRTDLALKAFKLCWFLTYIWAVSSVIVVYFGREPIINFYTPSEKIQESVTPAWYVLSIFTFFDCM